MISFLSLKAVMLFKIKPAIFFFFGLILLGCDAFQSEENQNFKKQKKISYQPELDSVDKSFIRQKRQESSDFYTENLGDERFNGMFLVAKNGKIIFEKYNGFANFQLDQKVSPNTPLHLASISKVATSIAILRLMDQKKILLDEDVRNFLPELPYEGISVRMLMNHRSGIPYYGYFTYETWDLGKNLKNKDVLLLLKKNKFPLNFPPNSHFAYCNTNYALLALIIEKVTGQPFPKAMQDLIFKPLEMTHTFILDKSKNKETISQSYSSGKIRQAFDYLDDVYGDKNMYSTVRDLLKMDIGTYSNAFLSQKAKKEMFKGYSYERSGTKNYGLGVRIVELDGKSPYFFHTGWWHGNTGCFATLRADTVSIIALSNVYNRSVYRINRLANSFGDYPFNFEHEE